MTLLASAGCFGSRTRVRLPLLFIATLAALTFTTVPLAAQNTADVLGGGPQPANTSGCAVNPNCMLATWSTTSNAGSDISSPIAASFVFATNGGAAPTDFPAATTGQICLSDRRDLTGTTVFAVIAANCTAAGGKALLFISDAGISAPSTIPVFTLTSADGDFLRNTVGFDATTGVSRYQVRINVAINTPPPNPTNQRNCPIGQKAPAFVGPGTANYSPNQSLCLPAAAGQAAEPSMIVDSQGTIYVESIRGVPGGLDMWRWYGAADGAPNANGTLPFKYEGQPDCGMLVTPFCTTSGFAPGGGDGDVAVNAPDPANNNTPNFALVSLSAAEVTGANSTNRGDTMSPPNPATTVVPFDDRMWLDAADDAKHVYMEYHDFGTTSQILIQRSNDGGFTYADGVWPAVDAATASSVGPPTGNIAGQVKVDKSSCSSHWNIYQIFVGPDNPLDNLNGQVFFVQNGLSNGTAYLNTVYVGVASEAGLAIPATAFTDYKIFSCGAGSTCPQGAGLGNLFPGLAVDKLGYLYATWSDNTDVYYSFSTNHGQRWSPAIKLTQGTSQAGKSNLFSWIAADANGHVAVAWYGADTAGNSNSLPLTTNWNVFVAESTNGHALKPTFKFSQATDHVNHTGQISTGGLTGSSDRSLADFFQIAMDPNHLVNIAYADNHAGPSVTYFTRAKRALGGISTGGKCAGTGHEAGGNGHQNGKHGGDAQFDFSYDDTTQTSSGASYTDAGSGVNFAASQVTSAVFDATSHSVTLVGSGTNNGLPVTFTIVAVDSSLVAPGTFSITLSSGYINTGNLTSGSVTVY